MSDSNVSGMNVPTPKYYNLHSAEPKKPSKKADGRSLYRSLAKLKIKDLRKHISALNEVLNYAIRVRSNSKDPHHVEYLAREKKHLVETNQPLFTSLDCPDMHPTEHVLWVISCALNIKIKVFTTINDGGEAGGLAMVAGTDNAFPHAVLRQKVDGEVPYRFASLLPDEAGKEIVEFMQAVHDQIESEANLPAHEQTYRGLKLKQMSWACARRMPNMHDDVDNTHYENVTSFNEHREESSIEDLDVTDPLSRMDCFVAVVNEPAHIAPALKLFKQMLEKAPNQIRQVRVGPNGEQGVTKPYIGADKEFVKIPRELADGKDRGQLNSLIAQGKIEELCSVFTAAVGRHFFLLVNILHMLENADATTVSALEQFYKEILFNPEIMKLWWNYQSDFQVLDNTIAHMYQGTPRKPLQYTWDDGPHELDRPFRISSPFLEGKRPAWTFLPSDDKPCLMHSPGKNLTGLACPCPLGNVDIAALLSLWCRQLGLGVDILPWIYCRYRVNYGTLQRMMLYPDRLFPLFNFMKDCAGLSGDFDFYQHLGKPGMEDDDIAMAYNIGDVAALCMIYEHFLNSDDRWFLIDNLASYAQLGYARLRQVPQRVSPLGAVNDVPLFEDNSKVFKHEPTWIGDGEMQKLKLGEMMARGNNAWAPQNLQSWQHDERAEISQTLAKTNIISQEHGTGPIFPSENVLEAGTTSERARAALARIPDPNMIWFPETCATIIKQDRPGPVVRAGTTHAEALLEFVKSRHATDASPPPGFGAAAGSPLGLPEHLKRVPGSTLPLARDIFEAFKANQGQTGELLGPLEAVPVRSTDPSNQSLDYQDLARRAVEARDNKNVWEAAEEAKRVLNYNIKQELNLNVEDGLPGPVDFNDLWDSYGRRYRAAVEATPEWNRPELRDLPQLGKDGAWQSVATLTLQALEQMAPDETEKEEKEWNCIALGRGGKRRVVSGTWSAWSNSHDSGYGSWDAGSGDAGGW